MHRLGQRGALRVCQLLMDAFRVGLCFTKGILHVGHNVGQVAHRRVLLGFSCVSVLPNDALEFGLDLVQLIPQFSHKSILVSQLGLKLPLRLFRLARSLCRQSTRGR
jgi:hypothetical protein